MIKFIASIYSFRYSEHLATEAKNVSLKKIFQNINLIFYRIPFKHHVTSDT